MAGYASSSTYVEGLPSGDKSEYQYNSPKSGLNVWRLPRVLNPIDQTYVSGQNSVLRFRLPNDCPIDFRKSFIKFDLKIDIPNGTYPLPSALPLNYPSGADQYKRMATLSSSPWERVRHHANNDTIEERTTYNRIYSMLWQTLQEKEVEQSIGLDLLGIDSQAQRAIAGLTTQTYVLPFDLGFLRSGVVPLHAFKTTVHEVEFYMADPRTFIETNTANPNITVTISNIEWHVETVTSWDGSYEKALWNMVDSSQYTVWFSDWKTYQNLVQATIQDLLISARAMSCNSIISAYYITSDQYNPLVNDKFSNFPKLDTRSFQFKITNRHLPEEAIECLGEGVEAYMYYLRWAGAWFANGFGGRPTKVSIDDFNLNTFVMVGDFRNNSADVLNNFSTENVTTDVVFKLQLDSTPPTGAAVMHYVNFNTVCQVLPSGKVLIRN
jgi:hypothetical protein